MYPVLFRLGPFEFRIYGLMIAIAFLSGLYLSQLEADRKGIGRKALQDFGFSALISGIIGARIYYILFSDFSFYLKNPLEMLFFWRGGLAVHGALLGGLIAAIFFVRKRKISFWAFADTMAPSLILAQGIGRIGCFFNGCSFGTPTRLPWGLKFSPESPAGITYPGIPLHPTSLYEMTLTFGAFFLIWNLRKKVSFDGALFLIYAIIAGGIRTFVEAFRADSLYFYDGIKVAQLLGVIVIVIFLFILLKRKKQLHKKSV